MAGNLSRLNLIPITRSKLLKQMGIERLIRNDCLRHLPIFCGLSRPDCNRKGMQNLPEGRKRSLQMSRLISVCLSGASQEIRLRCNRAPAIPEVILQTFHVQGRPGSRNVSCPQKVGVLWMGGHEKRLTLWASLGYVM